jgi:hypothetical protein
MITSKYIRHQHNFVFFNKNLVHADVAKKVFPKGLIHGAGFLLTSLDEHNHLKVVTYGKSESLNCEPRLDDASLIKSLLLNEDGLGFVCNDFDGLVFSRELKHKNVALALNSNHVESAGYVRLIPENGCLDVSMYGEAKDIGVKAVKVFNYRFSAYNALGVDPEFYPDLV